jgi:hypothetical protein
MKYLNIAYAGIMMLVSVIVTPIIFPAVSHDYLFVAFALGLLLVFFGIAPLMSENERFVIGFIIVAVTSVAIATLFAVI